MSKLVMVGLKVPKEAKDIWQAKAAASGKPLSEWIRDLCDAACQMPEPEFAAQPAVLMSTPESRAAYDKMLDEGDLEAITQASPPKRKAALCPRCSRIGVASCKECVKAAERLMPSREVQE